jgi:Glucodextranase, domain B
MDRFRVQSALFALVVACATGCTRSTPAPANAGQTASKAAVAPGTIAAVILARTGKVELSRNGGQWADARIGDELVPSDALRTEAGEAELALGPVHMRLHESSAVRVKETGKSSMRARVHGAVESDVEPGRGELDVEMDGTDAVARSTGGHFFVMADGRGVVSVATVSGSVNLVARKKQVEVKEGQVSRIEKGELSAPSTALRRVLLSVRWPEESTSKEAVPVSGKVEPESRVYIQGAPVKVEKDGSFTAQVPLHDGAQKVAVLVVDPLGRRKQAWATIVRQEAKRAEVASSSEPRKKKKEFQWR